jgi:shikimate kinase
LKIYLIGFMGAGKTSRGRKLAERLRIPFADMDAVIEKQEGMSVQEIFSLKGEEWFRAKETEVLHQLGEEKGDMVISTGGGVPCFNNNMEFINSTGLSVYLKMSPEALVRRLTRSNKPMRPLLKGKTETELLEYIHLKLSEREHFYLQSKKIVPAEYLKIKQLISYLRS